MPTNFTPENLFDATDVDVDGDQIGKVDEVYLDNASGEPEWVAVKTGLFGSNVSLVPLVEATRNGDTLTVPFEKDLVKGAPHHDPGHELSETEEKDLYHHYGTAAGGSVVDEPSVGDEVADVTTATHVDETPTAAVAHDTSGPNTDGATTRSREELRVGTETRESGRARLRKYITSEQVSRSVPVSHEEVVVEREPITEANRGDASSGGDLTEEEHEIVLTEERAVEAEVREEHIDLDAGTEVTTGNSRRSDQV